MTVIKMLGVTVLECGLITWLLITGNARFKNLHLENKNGNIIDNVVWGSLKLVFLFNFCIRELKEHCTCSNKVFAF